MKSITIHGVDDQLNSRLKQVAAAGGLSMNRTVKRLLEEALGLKPRSREPNRKEFQAFCGVWSQVDLDDFRQATKEFEEVNGGDWL